MGSVHNFPGEKPENCIRVMTANLWASDYFLEERIGIMAGIAETLNVDILLLQEAEHTRSELKEFIEKGYTIAALSPVTEDQWATAVLTKLPYETRDPIRYTVQESSGEQYAANALIDTPGGNKVLSVSAHLVHGGLHEHARLEQADILDREITEVIGTTDTLAILGGDMNCRPDSSTARFLEGIEPYKYRTAQWTDVWNVSGTGPGYTSSPVNRWARVTNSVNGSRDPWQSPERRIDRILVRGWVYGKPLYPLKAHVLDQEYIEYIGAPYPPSDHWTVVADLLY